MNTGRSILQGCLLNQPIKTADETRVKQRLTNPNADRPGQENGSGANIGSVVNVLTESLIDRQTASPDQHAQ